MTGLEKKHVGDLVGLAINVNAEIQARLNATLYILSSIEEKSDTLSKDDLLRMLTALLKALRGQMP